MSMRVVLLTNDGCPACEAAEAALEPEISEGEVEVKNIQSDDEAADLADRFVLTQVPMILLLNENNNLMAAMPVEGLDEGGAPAEAGPVEGLDEEPPYGQE